MLTGIFICWPPTLRHTGAAVKPSEHYWAWLVHPASWSAHPPVCRRQSNLYERASQWCTSSQPQLCCLHPWCQWVDVSQQTVAEPDQDAGHVAQLQPLAEARWHQRHPGHWERVRPRSYPWQPADTIGARHSALLRGVPQTPATTSTRWRRKLQEP